MRRCLILAFISLMVAVIVTGSTGARAAQPDPYTPAPDVMCGPGARPEATQGRVPQKDYDSGRAFKGYYCNAEKVAHFGDSGGYRVYRYTDTKGHVCAIYDTTLLWPTNVTTMGSNGT